MLLKEFYFYSPQKLKLITVKQLLPKFFLFITASLIIISFLSIVIYNYSFSTLESQTAVNQKIIDEHNKAEYNALLDKYNKLTFNYNNLIENTNDLRLAVNLEPMDFSETHIGIGGSEFTEIKDMTLIKDELKSLNIRANQLDVKAKIAVSNYNEVKTNLLNNKKLYSNIPAIKPANASIGDKYGFRYHPILKYRRMHYGLDFLTNTGEKVYATGNGTISYVGNKGGYGKVIRINHGYGYETIYSHLSKYKIKKGQKVSRGDIIALSGNSGSLSTGPHLHYEVRHNNKPLNPRNFFFEDLKMFN